MQTEEVVPRATSASIIDTGTPTEDIAQQQTHLQHLQSPVESFGSQMAVKQEPQEDEEREDQGRASSR